MKVISGKQLRAYFNILNKAYFNGEVPIPREIGFTDMKKYDGEFLLISDNSNNIHIHKDFETHTAPTVIALLHEMVHSKLRAQGYKREHGVRFCAEIDRLYKEGAYEEYL